MDAVRRWGTGWFDSPLRQIYHPRGMGQPRGFTAGVIFIGITAALAAGFFAGCGQKNRGTVPGPATRAAPTVASLSPAATDLILGMGAGDHLVAVSNFDAVGENLPRVGDYQTTDWEMLGMLRPAVLIVQMDPVRLPEGFREKARRLGTQVVNVKIDDLADVLNAARQIGRAVGEPARGEALAASLGARIEAVREKSGESPPVTTLLTLDERGETLVGPGTFLSDLLKAAGGINAAAPLAARYPKADAETLLALKPQAVIVLRPRGQAAMLEQARQFWARLPNVPAGKARRVFLLDDPGVLMPASHVADVAEQMYRCLHPDTRTAAAGGAS